MDFEEEGADGEEGEGGEGFVEVYGAKKRADLLIAICRVEFVDLAWRSRHSSVTVISAWRAMLDKDDCYTVTQMCIKDISLIRSFHLVPVWVYLLMYNMRLSLSVPSSLKQLE